MAMSIATSYKIKSGVKDADTREYKDYEPPETVAEAEPSLDSREGAWRKYVKLTPYNFSQPPADVPLVEDDDRDIDTTEYEQILKKDLWVQYGGQARVDFDSLMAVLDFNKQIKPPTDGWYFLEIVCFTFKPYAKGPRNPVPEQDQSWMSVSWNQR